MQLQAIGAADGLGGVVGSQVSVGLRAAVVFGSTVFAYHVSLNGPTSGHGSAIPLPYLSLVPILAILVAIVERLAAHADLDIHDRSLDYIIGVGFLLSTVVILCVLPVTLSLFFWVWRLDLLSLPFFVAGAVSITFGIRALWRHRLSILLLFVGWPMPYAILLASRHYDPLGFLNLLVVNRVLPGVEQFGSASTTAAEATLLSTHGFLALLGTMTAIALVVRGSRVAKIAWVVAALVAGLVADLAEVLLAAEFGHPPLWKETGTSSSFLTSGLPVAVALLSAFVMMGVFQLRLAVVHPVFRLRRRPAVHWAPFGVVLILITGWLAGDVNAGLPRYASVADTLGRSRIPAGAIGDFNLPGWTVAHSEQHRWAAVYLDKTATWTRYTYQHRRGDGSPDSSGGSLTIDVISTTDLGLLSTYGIEQSYRLQEHPRLMDASVDLSSGVIGRLVSYALDGNGATWTGLHWQWPVMGTNGRRYERIVVSARESLHGSITTAPVSDDGIVTTELAIVNRTLGPSQAAKAPQAVHLQNFMKWAGREFVTAAIAQANLSEASR